MQKDTVKPAPIVTRRYQNLCMQDFAFVIGPSELACLPHGAARAVQLQLSAAG